MKTRHLLYVLTLFVLCACSAQGTETRRTAEIPIPTISEQTKATETMPPRATPTQETLEIRGWFTIVWNGEPHYYIANAEMGTSQIVLDEKLIAQMGGALALDRKEVIITGETISADPKVIQVLTIRFANP